MIFKRLIAILILCMPVVNHAIKLSHDSDSPNVHVESLKNDSSNSELKVLYSPGTNESDFLKRWNYLRPFSTYLVNLLFGFGVSYGLYRYAPDKFPWIWAGTTTYSSLILSAAITSYGKYNQSLKEDKQTLIKEKNSLEEKNKKLEQLLLPKTTTEDKEPEVIVVRCSRERENLENELKLQREKTIEWHKRADELFVENQLLKDLGIKFRHLQSSCDMALNNNQLLKQELRKYQIQFEQAQLKIEALEEDKTVLTAGMLDLQNQLNRNSNCKKQVQRAREKVNEFYPRNLSNSWVTVNA